MFDFQPSRPAAYVYCHFFVGPRRFVKSRNTWATQPLDWLRVWRFRPGMSWRSHEPPVLLDEQGRNVAQINPFSRDETLGEGISFQHFAYATEAQVRFKEIYYGYRDAMNHWHRLQRASVPLDPADYLPWAKRGAIVAEWEGDGESHLAEKYFQDRNYSSMSVEGSTRFETELRALFQHLRPQRIIETGTYLGRGTSTIIWNALRDFGIQAEFCTIEVNPEHYRQAVAYFQVNNMPIRAELGITLPRSKLPDLEQIQAEFVQHRQFEGIYYDHRESERAARYFAETDFPVPDDLLHRIMEQYDFQPDFVLLDSAGHVGFAEFQYFLSMVRGECYLMLDDIYHCKHYRSLQYMKADPRFSLLVESPEKFGFCIAKFTPHPRAHPSLTPKDYASIIWLRTDSIGDNVLAAGTIAPLKAYYSAAKLYVVCQDHIAEIYETFPEVEKVFGFNRNRIFEDESYRNHFLLELQSLKADLLLNSVYSREALTDYLALNSCAKAAIALEGDLSNIDQDTLCRHNRLYSRLIGNGSEKSHELARHQVFLEGLGVAASNLAPRVHTSREDETAAETLCRIQDLKRDTTLAIFPGAQWGIKHYPHFGEALGELCRERRFTVVGIGGAADQAMCQSVLGAIGGRSLNLCGKLSLRQAAALLKRCRLAVGTDSAAAHIAAAVGTPQVVVMGGGHFGRFHPYSALTSVVCLPLSCYQCNWKCRFERPMCIRDIQPSIVAKAVGQSLERRSAHPRVFMQSSRLWSAAQGVGWQGLELEFSNRHVETVCCE
jgi:ADP-heptose:LPS heptosyltransferase